jgi:nitroreductase
MDMDKTIRGRRSVRKYRKEDVAGPLIDEILDLARHAPSSMNGQPWHFIVIRDEATKRRLVEIKNRHCPIEKQAYRADFLLHAPVIIVVCVDQGDSYDRGIENGLLAAANILLAAHARGLGSVYMSAQKADEPAVAEEIRRALGIPGHMDPISLLPLGRPDEQPGPKDMKPLKDIVSYEAFGKKQVESGSAR